MGYDSEGGNNPTPANLTRAPTTDMRLQVKYAAEREAKKVLERETQAVGLREQQETALVIVKILRKIHDPNKLTQFQKDLALVAVGAETLDWLKKEWS